MIYLRYLCENTAKIWRKYGENKQKFAIKTVRSADFRSLLSPAQESAPGNDGNVPSESERAEIRMNTAHPIRIQYS